ncbi:amino acid permease [Cryobacterium sp. PAMC25264]|uniref:amino acid permease n=1 Tax=Cryobacterium sp. PAMC25264 TaxID=2861288 RepID=UPI001C626113|nr:amino acid permease [Cryobacterium sp. PAMC25264]QYF73150.1 amino acid permease [Cryobacterium sp. PAMC25264]
MTDKLGTRATVKTKGPAAVMTVPTVAFLTAAAVVTSLRGLPIMAKEELTMFVYIGFATILFLVPAALISAELGSAFADRRGGVYTWIGEAFGQRWGFVGIWLQWAQNVVWYPTGLAFAAAAAAYALNSAGLADAHIYVGLFCIATYWLATLLAFRGNAVLAKVAKYGFLVGTVVPGAVLLGLFIYWAATGHAMGWSGATDPAVAITAGGETTPRVLPLLTGLGSLAFLGNIMLLFAGVEVQAVHVREMKSPRRGFPLAMLLASLIAVVVFLFGSIAVAGLVPYDDIVLQTGVFDAMGTVIVGLWNMSWLLQILAALVCYGALSGALAWISAPSRAMLATAHDGLLPPILQKTNSVGIQRNILILQAIIVTVVSSIYLFTADVSAAFFLISTVTVSLYIVMYLFMYAAAIRLRYTQPNLPRDFKIPGGNAGMWIVAGIGFIAVAFSLLVSFFPPTQLPIGNPVTYVSLVAGGLVVFVGAALLIYQFRKPSWKDAQPGQKRHDSSFLVPAMSTASNGSNVRVSEASAESAADRLEGAEDAFEEGLTNDALERLGLLPIPDATPSAGPAPAA